MSREMGGFSPESYQPAERENNAEELRRLADDIQGFRESVINQHAIHVNRRDVINYLCAAIESLMSEEIKLQQDPNAQSTNRFAEPYLRRALTWLDYDTKQRESPK